MKEMEKDVAQRNFFRLLRGGTFGDAEQVEPMSAWKWRRVYQLSLMHGVAALVWDGIASHGGDFFMRLPEELSAEWRKTAKEIEGGNARLNEAVASLFDTFNREQLRPMLLKGQGLAALYPNPAHRTGGDIDIYFPYAPQARKADRWAESNGDGIDSGERGKMRYQWRGIDIDHHRTPLQLTNFILNRRLQGIIVKETRCCDSAYATIGGTRVEVMPPTLNLLLLITRIARYIVSEGISLKQMADLGVFLRTMGDKVDYVKLQGWTRQLGLRRMARVEGALLTRLFHLDADEMQFADGGTEEDTWRIEADISQLSGSHTDDWYFTQGKNIFVRTSDTGAMMWHIRHNASYFKYYPQEAFTNFFASFAHSLSHIEE